MKRIPNPVEYCTNQPTTDIPSVYCGHYVVLAVSNNDTIDQDQAQKHNMKEKTSPENTVTIDNEGREIDLNKPYYNDEDINEHQN